MNTTSSGSAVLSATLLFGGEGLTATALVSGASKALGIARQFDWVGGESRRFSVIVTCRGVKHHLSYLVTFDYPK